MEIYRATAVEVFADVDYGEGDVSFQWPDALYGTEGLTIDLDGHCSRNMPVRSGGGPPHMILERDNIKLRFSPELAKRLLLAEEIEIRFDIGDDEFQSLQRVIDYFEGDGP
jgi:hypothetical protein